MTTDPYRQYSSPYVGMGNDPINGIDPDGGYKTKWGRFWGWVGGGFKGSFTGSGNGATPEHNYGIAKRGDASITFDFGLNKGGGQGLLDYGYKDNGVNFYNPGYGFMRERKITPIIRAGESKDFFVSAAYGTVNSPWITFQALNPFDDQIQNLDGTGSYGGKFMDDAALGLTSFISAGYGQFAKKLKYLKSTPKLYGTFSKLTKGLFKGSNHNKLRSAAYKTMIKVHNNKTKFFKETNKVFNELQGGIDFVKNVFKKE